MSPRDHGPAPRFKDYVARQVDPGLWQVCMRALTPAQERRQQSAGQLVEELEAWLAAPD